MEQYTYSLERYTLCFSFYSGIDEVDDGTHSLSKKDLDDYFGIQGSICFLKGEPNLFLSHVPKPVPPIYSFWTKVLKLSDEEIKAHEINDGHIYLNLLFEKFKNILSTHNITREKVAYIEKTFDMACTVQIYSYGDIIPGYYLLKEQIQLIASLQAGIDISTLPKNRMFLLNGIDY
ncbi:hypothetical protein [Bacillus sp. 1P02SD]|uniref:hypothetical protein n=1 Tax=Bacillus sp. 1P02SD TaxID=3132264 RepID=UPI0039A1CDAC